ncbi:unnamed protein product [Polarella glacialis]|nr:unnamed protein product [Polarella glacialis]
MLVPLRVPATPWGRARTVLLGNSSQVRGVARAPPSSAQELAHTVSSKAGDYLFFHALRYHAQMRPSGEQDFPEPGSDPRRDTLVGFALRQVPLDGSGRGRGSGRWLLLRMCQGTSDPKLKADSALECAFCESVDSNCSRCA